VHNAPGRSQDTGFGAWAKRNEILPIRYAPHVICWAGTLIMTKRSRLAMNVVRAAGDSERVVGAAILLVSHAMTKIEQSCERAVLLELFI
jgi:hypothetical protein